MAYTLYTQAFGSSNANFPVKIIDSVSGIPATILATAGGGVISTNGDAKLDSNGTLSVYLDMSHAWLIQVIDGNIDPIYPTFQTITSTQLSNGFQGLFGIIYVLNTPPYTFYSWTGSAFAATPTVTGVNQLNQAIAAGAIVSVNSSGVLVNSATGQPIPLGTTTIPTAGPTTLGAIQLAGDIGGTATAPTVPGLANKVNSSAVGTTGGALLSATTPTAARNTLGLGSAAIANTTDFAPVSISAELGSHEANTDNPHGTTQGQVGLSNVNNTSDINKPVSTAQAAALALKVDVASLGGSTAVTNLSAKALANTINREGHAVVTIGASTSARCNSNYGVTNGTYSRTNGIASFRVTQNLADVAVGRYCRLAVNNRADISVSGTVLSITPESSGSRITMTDPRPNIASVSGSQIEWHDLQQWANTESWCLWLNMLCGGSLDITNMSTGGSNPDYWISAAGIAAMQAMPYYDYAIVDFGYPNYLSDSTLGATSLMQKIETALAVVTTKARKVIFVSTAGARLNDSHTPADFTLLSRTLTYMKHNLSNRWPTLEFVDLASAASKPSTYGATTTADMIAGYPPIEFIANDNVHWTPLLSMELARLLAGVILKTSERWNPFQLGLVDNVFLNGVSDINSGIGQDGGYISNGLYSWYGQVDTANLNLAGVGNLGQTISGMTITAQGLTVRMSGSSGVANSPDGGRELNISFNDPSDGSAGFQLVYTGASVNSGAATYNIVTMLADTRFQEVDCDAWMDFGIYGFNPNGVGSIEITLVGNSTESGSQVIASWLANQGANRIGGTGRAWYHGFNGILRTPKFKIPAKSYTSGSIIITVSGVAGTPMGSCFVRMGKMRLSVRQPLL